MLQICLFPSKAFLSIAGIVLLGSMLCIFYSDLPGFLRFSLNGMALAYGGRVLWRDILLRDENAVVSFGCSDDNSWRLQLRSGTICPAVLSSDSVVTAYCCLLRFKIAGQRRKKNCVIMKDALDDDHYRQLLMRLRSIKIIKKTQDATI